MQIEILFFYWKNVKHNMLNNVYGKINIVTYKMQIK